MSEDVTLSVLFFSIRLETTIEYVSCFADDISMYMTIKGGMVAVYYGHLKDVNINEFNDLKIK